MQLKLWPAFSAAMVINRILAQSPAGHIGPSRCHSGASIIRVAIRHSGQRRGPEGSSRGRPTSTFGILAHFNGSVGRKLDVGVLPQRRRSVTRSKEFLLSFDETVPSFMRDTGSTIQQQTG